MELRFGRQVVRFLPRRWDPAEHALSVYVSGSAADAELLQVDDGWNVLSDDESGPWSLTQGALETILIDVLGLRQ